jgi:DNA-binding response OmpR family regulator
MALILIIDKERLNRALIGAQLEEEGYKAIGAETIEQAISQINQGNKPDILLLCPSGQNINGEAMKRLEAVCGAIPLVIYRGVFDPLYSLPWKGRLYSLSKPVSIGQIVDRIKGLKISQHG